MATETDNSQNTTRTADDAKTPADQIKTPLLAALGAGNLAGQAVSDALSKARTRYSESSESVRRNVEDAKKNFEELPSEFDSLREKLEPAELRKLLDEYTDAALKLYHRLAESGEEAWDKLLAQPQFKKATDQLGETFQTVQVRVDEATSDVRKGIDDVVSRVTSTVRGAGDEASQVVEATAEKISGAAGKAESAVEDTTATSHSTQSAQSAQSTETAGTTETPAGGSKSSGSAKSASTKSTTTRRTTTNASASAKKSTGGTGSKNTK